MILDCFLSNVERRDAKRRLGTGQKRIILLILSVIAAYFLADVVVAPLLSDKGSTPLQTKRISTLERLQLKGGSVLETSTLTIIRSDH